MIKGYWNKGKKQKTVIVIISVVLLIVIFVLRDAYQPILLFVRKFLSIIIMSAITLIIGFRKIRKSERVLKRLIILSALLILFSMCYIIGWHYKMYDYMQTYNVFNNLNKIEINELPLTQNERIQPLRNILAMANESVGETKDVSLPHLVRVDNENKWTMAIQPSKKYIWQRISDNIEEVFSVSSTSPFPRFSNENRIPVTFSIGESLKFSRNTYNAVVQRFDLWKLLNYEPSDVFYLKNDLGQWVEVVSLIKWKGFFFPYPTFAGVMIIENGPHTLKDYIERLFVGKGTYISPSNMAHYSFLRGQNTLSEKVSRLQAKSLKFLGGFTDPLPWNKKTAVKIPDLENDQNKQPFVTDFNFTGTNTNAYNGLYHWFGLEPIGLQRTSLTYSVFIPADGNNTIYYYDHASKKQGYAGVSAMPLKVKESRKEYDWSVNAAVEFRPYIKEIAGRKRLFFLGTVSAKNENGQFDGAATPDLALIDSEYRDVVWIDVKHPSKWNEMIYQQLNEAWRSSEGIDYYYTKDTIPKIDTAMKTIDSFRIKQKREGNNLKIKELQKQIDSLTSSSKTN